MNWTIMQQAHKKLAGLLANPPEGKPAETTEDPG
jgi:hypothetical protein